MKTFADLGLSKNALNAVKKLGFTSPTPVQEQAISPILDGKDVIAAASTGTGKTAAFLLPVLDKLEKVKRGRRAPRVLVVTPTRELAEQIAFTSYKVARECGHYTTVVYGGSPYKKQIQQLREGTDVLIATPGRLCDLMDRDVVDLSKIEVLVLDEADRMLDMGFLPDVRKIVEKIPEDRQTLLFSATIDASIKNNLGSLLVDPEVIQIAKKGETAAMVEQFLIPIPSKEKPDLLKALLDELGHDKVVVFARTKARAENVTEMLNDAGFEATSIHSDKNQGQRRQALAAFRKGKVGIIVATDVLARGIDVDSIDYVVNYDLPDMPEDYIHRIGRTGRAGETGYAVSFVSPNSLKVLDAIQTLIKRDIPIMNLKSYETDPKIIKRKSNAKGQGSKRQDSKRNKSVNSKKNPAKNAPSRSRNKKSKTTTSKSKSSNYDYTGYGDLRKGKKKRKDVREGANSKRPGQNASSNSNSTGRKQRTSSRSFTGNKNIPNKANRKKAIRPGMRSSGLR